MSVTEGLDAGRALAEIVEVTEHMISDWGLELPEGVGSATRLVADLDFDSIDLVCLFVAIEERHEGTAFGFEDLVAVDGEYVEDLSLAEVAAFVRERLGGE